MTFRLHVAKRAREIGKTVSAALAEAGLGPSFLKDIGQGRVRSPRVESLLALANALEVDVATVTEWIELPDKNMTKDQALKVISGELRDVLDRSKVKPRPSVVDIPELDVEAAAGGGSLVSAEDVRERWTFPASFVRAELGAGRSDLHVITIAGDSMVSDPPKPRDLYPGDKVVVNVAAKTPSPPGIFIVDDGFGLVAKRVEVVPRSEPPRIRLTSNNPAYSAYEVDLVEARIIGRVVMRLERL